MFMNVYNGFKIVQQVEPVYIGWLTERCMEDNYVRISRWYPCYLPVGKQIMNFLKVTFSIRKHENFDAALPKHFFFHAHKCIKCLYMWNLNVFFKLHVPFARRKPPLKLQQNARAPSAAVVSITSKTVK